jgi:hypothetical protein
VDRQIGEGWENLPFEPSAIVDKHAEHSGGEALREILCDVEQADLEASHSSAEERSWKEGLR